MNRPKKLRIGELLVKGGLITQEQLAVALETQKKTGHKLGDTLVALGTLTSKRMLQCLADQLQIPYIDLQTFKFDPPTVRLLPEGHARRFRAIALEDHPTHLLIGMADPTDLFAFDELAKLIKRPVRQAIVRETDLLRALDKVYRRTDEIVSIAEELGEELAAGDTNLAELLPVGELQDMPVVRLLRSLFQDAVQVSASDIHIEPDEKVLRIRQRIDGVLYEQVMKEKRIAPALVSRLKLMSGLDIAERRLPQDGRFNIKVRGKSIDIRISTMPLQHGEAVVMRLLDQSSGILALEQLGMTPKVLDAFRTFLHFPHGMVLVTGPTGSGKTTTLYAALNELNQTEKKIITVEDPVEYRLDRINQVQVHPQIGLTFANVLRSALRHDPDIMLIGEMRDQETAEIGLRAAMTGHMVFSTLHTNDAISTAMRLLDMGAEGYLVASALRAVLAQRLVRRLCEGCAEETFPDPQQASWLKAYLGEEAASRKFMRGVGCTHCHETGYYGRIGVFELLRIDDTLADALRRDDSGGFAIAARNQKGFQPLAKSALAFAMRGVTSMEEVLRVAGQVEELPPLATESA